MATLDSSPPDIEPDTDLDANPNSSDAFVPAFSRPPTICFIASAQNAACGALMGSIIGFGSGLVKRKGFKIALGNAGSSAKSFALLSGVHNLVVCLLRFIRRKEDVFNSGIAGCCTGLALSSPATPQELLKNCLTFGAFSLIVEGINTRQASAHSYPMKNKSINNTLRYTGPPTLAIPLPVELTGAFDAFCKSLKKPKGAFPTPQ